MSELGPNIHDSTKADRRDEFHLPINLEWDISSTTEEVTAHATQFDNFLDNISDNWLTDDDIYALKLCFIEALADAAKHGNKYDPKKMIHVEIKMGDQEFTVSVADTSNPVPFDPDKVPDPTDPKNIMKPSGRGILFMKHFFNEDVKWEFTNPGNMVTMKKFRK